MAFLQNYSRLGWANPSLSQTFSSNAGRFDVSFELKQRGGIRKASTFSSMAKRSQRP